MTSLGTLGRRFSPSRGVIPRQQPAGDGAAQHQQNHQQDPRHRDKGQCPCMGYGMLIELLPARQDQGRAQQNRGGQPQHPLQQDGNDRRRSRLGRVPGGPKGSHHVSTHHSRQDAVEKKSRHRQLCGPTPPHRRSGHFQQKVPAHDRNQHHPAVCRQGTHQPARVGLADDPGKLLPIQLGGQKPESSRRKDHPGHPPQPRLGFLLHTKSGLAAGTADPRGLQQAPML